MVLAGRTSADTVEQFGGSDVQRPRELDDGAEPRLTPCAFEKADLGAVEVAQEAKGFLAKARSCALTAEVLREALGGVHAAHRLGVTTKPLQTIRFGGATLRSWRGATDRILNG